MKKTTAKDNDLTSIENISNIKHVESLIFDLQLSWDSIVFLQSKLKSNALDVKKYYDLLDKNPPKPEYNKYKKKIEVSLSASQTCVNKLLLEHIRYKCLVTTAKKSGIEITS